MDVATEDTSGYVQCGLCWLVYDIQPGIEYGCPDPECNTERSPDMGDDSSPKASGRVFVEKKTSPAFGDPSATLTTYAWQNQRTAAHTADDDEE